MPRYKAHSLGHFAEQFACADGNKGKAKLEPSGSSGTRKRKQHGVTIHEPGAGSGKVIRVESSSEEQRGRGSSCEGYWNLEEPGLKNAELGDQIARINQVESDEILARSLQEEINRELQTPDESDEEMLDGIDMLTDNSQAEDEDHHDAMPFKRHSHELSRIDRSMEHFPFQGPTMQIPKRGRTEMRFSGPEMEHEMSLLSQIRQGLSSSQMNHAKKLELLEELEVFYESRADMDIPDDFYPYFYNDDDEDVVPMDETFGATENQINSLPVSTVEEVNSVVDACIICLETPSSGAVMRHLPCLHKYHKECIDIWLRIRNCCPVCKLAID